MVFSIKFDLCKSVKDLKNYIEKKVGSNNQIYVLKYENKILSNEKRIAKSIQHDDYSNSIIFDLIPIDKYGISYLNVINNIVPKDMVKISFFHNNYENKLFILEFEYNQRVADLKNIFLHKLVYGRNLAEHRENKIFNTNLLVFIYKGELLLDNSIRLIRLFDNLQFDISPVIQVINLENQSEPMFFMGNIIKTPLLSNNDFVESLKRLLNNNYTTEVELILYELRKSKINENNDHDEFTGISNKQNPALSLWSSKLIRNYINNMIIKQFYNPQKELLEFMRHFYAEYVSLPNNRDQKAYMILDNNEENLNIFLNIKKKNKMNSTNNTLVWKNIVTMYKLHDEQHLINLKNKVIGKKDSILIIADLVNAKQIKYNKSNFETNNQDSVLVWPLATFHIKWDFMNIKSNTLIYELKEIPTTIYFLKVVLWVDDIQNNIYPFLDDLERNNISCLRCETTGEALAIIEKSKWLLKLNKNFKIITNMARVENGLKNKMAGIDLIKALRDEYMYMEPIFVITNEEERNDVEFIMKECKLSDRIYMIGSKIEDLNYFFRDFKDFNEFRDFNIQQEHMLNSTINAGKCCVSSVSCNWSKCIIY